MILGFAGCAKRVRACSSHAEHCTGTEQSVGIMECMRCDLNINIYYGGRGLIDDPTIYVINKMQEILEELRVRVDRYNLYEHKHTIPTLPQTMKNADGIILATTIEWYGIGGYMQQFLDACWLYGDKEKIAKIYMCPIVMSTTYGEREGKLNLVTAWEILGGQPCSGLCGYIADTVTLELNEQYTQLIEKKAEHMYRSINQKVPSFPASNQAVKQMVSITHNVDLTPQETEQLSQYISDDSYVQRQKEDIQELTSLFRNKLIKEDGSYEEAYLANIRRAYQAGEDGKASFAISIGDREQPLIIKVNRGTLECYYGNNLDTDVEMSLSKASFEEIISGRMTFQRAFMTGAMKMKGDFMMLRMLDQSFVFQA